MDKTDTLEKAFRATFEAALEHYGAAELIDTLSIMLYDRAQEAAADAARTNNAGKKLLALNAKRHYLRASDELKQMAEKLEDKHESV